MWVLFVIGIIIIFWIWCKLPGMVKALIALFLLLATPFTDGISFALLAILLILSSLFRL